MSECVYVGGIPIGKLKDNYAVVVLQDQHDFEDIILGGKETAFVDDQKVYCIRGKNCFVFYHYSTDFVKRYAKKKRFVRGVKRSVESEVYERAKE